MGQIISLVNQKGGVGKTTSSVNIAYALSLKNYKTLVIDMDPQGNASRALSSDPKRPGIYPALCSRLSIEETIQKTDLDNLFLISSDSHLAGFSREFIHARSWAFLLKESLKGLKENFDFLFIDSPPSLGPLTVNVLAASRYFIVPLQCEYYALEGLSQLVQAVRRVKESLNRDLEMAGILLTMSDSRNRLSGEIEKEVRRHFEDKVFQTIVPRNIRLSEAPGFGKSIFQYDPRSQGAKAYFDVATELESRLALKADKIYSQEKSVHREHGQNYREALT